MGVRSLPTNRVSRSPNFDVKLIPIDKILQKRSFIYCETSKDPMDIGTIVTKTASDFASGHTAQGIADIVDAGLKAILGSSQASKKTENI